MPDYTSIWRKVIWCTKIQHPALGLDRKLLTRLWLLDNISYGKLWELFDTFGGNAELISESADFLQLFDDLFTNLITGVIPFDSADATILNLRLGRLI